MDSFTPSKPVPRCFPWTAAIALAAAALYLFHWDRYPFGYFVDDGGYVSLARSLLKGHFRYAHFPGFPPATDVLPGFPLWLSVFLSAGVPVGGLKFLSIALTLGTVLLINAHLKCGITPGERALFVVLALFHPLTVFFSGAVLAEPFFVFLVVLTWVAYSRAVSEKTSWGALAVLGAAAAVLVRPEGIFLSLAFLGVGKKRALSRWVAYGAGAAGTAVVWVLLTGAEAVGPFPTYFAMTTSLGGRGFLGGAGFVEMMGVLGKEILWPHTFQGSPGRAGGGVAVLLTLFLLWLGFQRFWREDKETIKPLVVFGLAYLLLHLMFPVKQARYFLVFVPWVSLALARGVGLLPRGRWALTLLLLAPVAWFGFQAVQENVRRAGHRRFPGEAMARLSGISNASVVLSRAPAVVYLRTGHVGRVFLPAPDRDTFYRALLANGIRHVLAGSFGVQELPLNDSRHGLYWARRRDWLENPRRYKLLWSSGEHALFEVKESVVFMDAWENYERGRSLVVDGGGEESLRWFRRAVERDPDFGLGFAALGTALWLSNGSLPEARALLDRALSLNPDLVFARRNRDAIPIQ